MEIFHFCCFSRRPSRNCQNYYDYLLGQDPTKEKPDYLKGEYSTYCDNYHKEMIRTQEENSTRTLDTAALEVVSSNMKILILKLM